MSADAPTLVRIRERLADTGESDRALRVMLVLAHEAVRRRQEAALAVDQGDAVRVTAPTAPVDRDDYSELLARLHEIVAASVPAGAKILVVSRGDESLLVPGYEAGHFPQGRAGAYAGFYPQDSAAAIEHLDHLRADGAEFLIVPSTAYWWLDYYGELAQHLLVGARIVHHDEHCLICDLRLQHEGASTE